MLGLPARRPLLLLLASATSVLAGGQDAEGPALLPPLDRPLTVEPPPAPPVPTPGRSIPLIDPSRLRPSTRLTRPIPAAARSSTLESPPLESIGLEGPAATPTRDPSAPSLGIRPQPPANPVASSSLEAPPLEGPGTPTLLPSSAVSLEAPVLPPAAISEAEATLDTLPPPSDPGFALPRFGGPRLPIDGLEAPAVDPLPPIDAPVSPPTTAGSGPRVLTLETLPDDTLPPLPGPGPGPGERSGFDRPGSSREAKRPKADLPDPFADEEQPEPPSDPPSPPRRRGLLGLTLPGTAPARRPPEREVPPPPRGRDKSDPSVDSALQRRIESQVREVAGRHLRSLDVRVRDRRVRIQVRVDRFWNKRSVRRSIETLPILAGHDVDIDLDAE